MKNKAVWIIAAIAVISVLFYFAFSSRPKAIGGEKDSHGCLIAAGYSWCDAKQKCLRVWEEPCESEISETSDIILNKQDLQQLGMALDEAGCQTDEAYSNIVDSSVGQYSICSYIIPSLNDTSVIIELQKFANYEALNGSYLYSSSHLYSVEGIISQNDYGDQSTFRANNENDYMGHLNEPGIYYYHLWICKDLYLIHITSGGAREADGYITDVARLILSKLG